MSSQLAHTFDLGYLGDVDCEIDYDYEPGDPGCHTMRNGDPGWPPTGANASINSITTVGGIDITKLFSKDALELVEEIIIEHEDEAAQPDPDAQHDEWRALQFLGGNHD